MSLRPDSYREIPLFKKQRISRGNLQLCLYDKQLVKDKVEDCHGHFLFIFYGKYPYDDIYLFRHRFHFHNLGHHTFKQTFNARFEGNK